MDFDAEDGGTSANSLCSVEFADDYLVTECLGTDDWQGYSAANKEAALIQATRKVEGLAFKGWPTTTTQALSFPRSGLYKKNWQTYDSDATPDDVKRAVAWWAFELMQGSSQSAAFAGMDLSAFKRVEVGTDKFELRDQRAGGGMPDLVSTLLRPFMLSSQAKLLRA